MSTNTTNTATAAPSTATAPNTNTVTGTNTPAAPLAGRVAVITGASSGLGEAAASELAALGATVVALARRADRLTDLVARIAKDGGTAIAIAADVTDPVALQAAADRVQADFGGADLVFNNAGVMLPAPIEQLAVEQWRHQIDLNITGVMNVIAAFTPQLIAAAAEKGVADLINTSSIAAQNIYPGFAVYCGTKAYATHLSKQLRAELGPKERPRVGDRAGHRRHRAAVPRHRCPRAAVAGRRGAVDGVPRPRGRRPHHRLPGRAAATGEPAAGHDHADRPGQLDQPGRGVRALRWCDHRRPHR
jgi:NADP-dependent 3-hydroxy acid dehydrogenase YdfG